MIFFYFNVYFVYMERTFVLIKPGILQRRLAGEVIARFERKGLKITALKMIRPDRALMERHYAEHRDKVFYEKLLEYSLSGPAIAMVLEGEEAITLARRLAGPTELLESQPGTIRGDLAASTRKNIVHTSDSGKNAEREIKLFFKKEEILKWEDANEVWL